LRKPHVVPTLADIITAYEKHINEFNLTIEPSVVANNRRSLRRVCAHALGLFEESKHKRRVIDDARVDRLPTTVLTDGLVEKFLTNYVGEAGTDRVERNAKIRGAVSTLRQARSLSRNRERNVIARCIYPTSRVLVADRQGEEIAARFVRHKPRSVGGRFYQTHRTPPAPISLANCGLTSASKFTYVGELAGSL
jgi:hypothetical protein